MVETFDFNMDVHKEPASDGRPTKENPSPQCACRKVKGKE